MPTPFPAPRLTGLLLRASPGDLGRAPTPPPAPDAAATAAVANGDAADANASKPVRFAGVGCASDAADDANGKPEAPASRLELDAAGDVSDGVGAGAEPLSAEPLLPKGEEEDGPDPAFGPGLARPLVQGAAAVDGFLEPKRLGPWTAAKGDAAEAYERNPPPYQQRVCA